MANEYKGIIVEESLVDNRIINNFKIVGSRISSDENPEDRWHLYTIMATPEDTEVLSGNIKPKWYMHFWRGKEIIVIFQGKKFEFNYDDKSSWRPAVEFGLSMGIPKEQLDFVID